MEECGCIGYNPSCIPERYRSTAASDFYNSTCEEVESIVKEAMKTKLRAAPTSAAGTLRLFFHDCFVNGCDGSVLLASADENKAERDADVNLSLPGDGFDAMVKAKEAVEKACPGVVSCADLLAIATGDLIGLVGGPFYQVQQGRRDSRVSRALDATQQLPGAEDSVERLTEMFAAKGLSQQELVTLSGGHTVGFVHCAQFFNRIYNFHPDAQTDPTLDPAFAAHLRDSCPRTHLDPRVVVNFDAATPNFFDNAYYKDLMHGRGVMSSDLRLFSHPHTSAQVAKLRSLERPLRPRLRRRNQEARQLGRVDGQRGRNSPRLLSCELRFLTQRWARTLELKTSTTSLFNAACLNLPPILSSCAAHRRSHCCRHSQSPYPALHSNLNRLRIEHEERERNCMCDHTRDPYPGEQSVSFGKGVISLEHHRMVYGIGRGRRYAELVMSEEEQEGVDEYEAPRPAVLQAERVRARPRHSLPRRLARAARAALQSHFPSLPPLKVAASSRIPLAPERATGLFRSGALETHIARALGNTVGLDGITSAKHESLKLFSAVKNLPGSVTHAVGSLDEGFRPLQLSGKHRLGPTTVCETMLQGTKISLLELQLRMVHTLINPQQSDVAHPKPAGRIALVTGTDLQSRHRMTMESTFGSEDGKHSLSTVISSDLHSRLSWGLSSSLNVNEKQVIFSRYNNDAHAGQRVIFQAVGKVDARNTVSPICAITLGSGIQGGLSWTRSFSQHGASEESIQLKALSSSNGSYMISVKAQLGEVES